MADDDALARVLAMRAEGERSQAYLDGVHDGSIVALFPPGEVGGTVYGRRFTIRPAWLDDGRERYGHDGNLRHDLLVQRLVERANGRGHNAEWRPWPTLPPPGDARAEALHHLAALREAMTRMTYPNPLRAGEQRNVADHVAHRHLETLDHIIRSTLMGPREPLLFIDRPRPEETRDHRTD